MMQRVLIEFVVEIPNADVAKDVETRLVREHHASLCETFKSVTGYEPLQKPGQPGLLVAHEPVTWNENEQDWVGESDGDDVGDDE
jgi:hypothetical protein